MILPVMIYLGWNAWTDGKRREIDLRCTGIFVFVITALNLWTGTAQKWSGLLPGLCLCSLSWWKEEKIGKGDGILVMGLGWAVGLERVCEILAGGFLLAGCAGILLFAAKKKTAEIPFAPFLLMSFMLETLKSGGGF